MPRGRHDDLFDWARGFYDRDITPADLTVEALEKQGVADCVPEEDYGWWQQSLTRFRKLNTNARQAAIWSYYRRRENKMQTIDLNTLLHEDPTWEQVVDFFKNGEFDSEQYLVEAIKKHLRTEEQRKRLADADVSIEEMLNGTYKGGTMDMVNEIYKEWNAKLGFNSFYAY